jgi:arylformamidase
MSFDDLPELPPLIHPAAKGYAERCMAWTREVQARERVTVDVAYGKDYWQKLDVYTPANAKGAKLPVVVFFHGGAWTNGTKEWMGFMAPPALAYPAIFVTANYRLAPACRFPGPFEDCCDAVAWVYRSIGEYGGDPERIFVGGHSAGGHLAALTALRHDRLAARDLPPAVIKGCLPISGSFDLRIPGSTTDSSETRMSELFLSNSHDAEAASPILFLTHQSPPFLVTYGSDDFPRLIKQAEEMAAKMKQRKIACTVLRIQDADHFEVNERCRHAHGEWNRTVRDWMLQIG